MSGAATLASPASGVGALEIDEAQRSASVGGDELYLSEAEFGLLSALASEPGRVFTHAELGEICFVGVLKIERCAERLARKLELRGMEGQLRRVPGAGLALGAGAEAIGALR